MELQMNGNNYDNPVSLGFGKTERKELAVIEYSNQRVLTTQQLAQVYECGEERIRQSFSRNKERFIEGKHYYKLIGNELRKFKTEYLNDTQLKHAKELMLWTEKGADRHCKILDTDKAWEQFDNLEETYFKVKDSFNLPQTFSQALRLYADQIEENEKLLLQNKQLEKEVEHKEDVIIGLVDNIDTAEKRQVLNRVVRFKGADYRVRYAELYKQFEMKYHINLKLRVDKYNRENKPKVRNKIDYIDKVMNKIPELYEIACKLYENDVKALCEEMYGIQIEAA